jgi:hypothetical protein
MYMFLRKHSGIFDLSIISTTNQYDLVQAGLTVQEKKDVDEGHTSNQQKEDFCIRPW